MRHVTLLLIATIGACSASQPLKQSDTLEKYISAIHDDVASHWHRPNPFYEDIVCTIYVVQNRDGVVEAAEVKDCNASDEVAVSVRDAVLSASPLPIPDDPELFDENIVFHFLCPAD